MTAGAIRVRTTFLPFLSVVWVSKDRLVAAGHDCSPMLYTLGPDNQLTFTCKLDVAQKREAGGLR